LRAHGVGADSLVGLALPRGATAITAILATLISGAAYLPLDPQWPAARLAGVIGQARPALVLANRDQPAAWEAPTLDPASLAGDPAAPVIAIDLGRPAYVIYTSGSTGEPKGVVISHRALAGFVAGAGER